ncbi:MAG TPA: delta-60 repeat domain-containing protein [Methanospirillum sp.]|nr:delta-60 repeat domain-containing protein [Methanospirillum sp.]
MYAHFRTWSVGIIAGVLLVLMLSFSTIAAEEVPSSPLDLTFNEPNGYALWHTPNASQDRNLEMVIQKDGKILLGGYTNDTRQKDIHILRYLSDGTPDPSFGDGGQILYSGDEGKDDYAFGLTLDADDNILISGREHNGHDSDILLLKCTPDGTPDETFGDNGTVRYAGQGSGTDSGRGVVVQQDGKIVVCGEVNVSSHKELAVLRYTSNGTPDPDFASGGVFLLGKLGGKESYGYASALDMEENILVTGAVTIDKKVGIGLLRLHGNGTVDTTFGQRGVAIWNGSTGGPDYGNWITVTPEGKILVTGVETDSSGSFDIILLRFNQDGTLDTAFGENGVARFGGSGYDYAWGQTIMPDGRIIIAGTSLVNGLQTPILIRLTQDGKPDSSFGTNGVTSFETIGIGPLYAVHHDNAGKILASGYITEEDTDLGLLLRMNIE